ncbi:MAG TPA: ABC transporter permease, partial [bacterium]|nr:ABC transporter permease [bacterium]
MHIRRIKAVARKEVRHILRDPFTLAMALFAPVFLVILFGAAIDLDIHDIELAAFDEDNTQASRMLLQTFTNSNYFRIVDSPEAVDPERALRGNAAKVVLVIPKEFEENLTAGRIARAQLLIDGSDNSVVGPIMNYLGGIQASASEKLAPLRTSIGGVEIVPRYLFNPEQRSAWFIVPGLSVVILAILSILLTALTVAREWETGSMELLLSTPIDTADIIAGKIAPYVALGLFGTLLVYLGARLVFGVPFVGSHPLFLLGTLLFLGTYLALGLLISVVARQQQLAMEMSIIAGWLPSLLFSGFIFSIQS